MEINKQLLKFLICYLIIILILEILFRQKLYNNSIDYIIELQKNNNNSTSTFLYKYLKGIEAIFSFNISDYAAIIIGFFYSIKDSYIFMFIFSISAYTNSILKLIYRNHRPFWDNPLIKFNKCSAGFGNPSGHSARNSIIFLSIYYYISNSKYIKDKNILKKVIIIPILLIIFSVMYSRIFEGMHTFNQILFGFSFGVFFFILWFYLLKIQNFTSKYILEIAENKNFLLTFSLVIFLTPFPIYWFTSGITNIDELNKIILQIDKCKKIAERKKFFKTGLISTMKSTLQIGGVLGFYFIKKMINKYPCDEEQILSWKEYNYRMKFIRTIIILIIVIPINFLIDNFYYKGNYFFLTVLYEIITSLIFGFIIFGPTVYYSYIICNYFIKGNKIGNNIFLKLIPDFNPNDINSNISKGTNDILLNEQ